MLQNKWNIYELYSYIARELPLTIKLKINNNSSTIFSFRKNGRNEVKINLHKMFLNAPQEVINSITLLVKQPRSKEHNQVVRSFINLNYDKIEGKENNIFSEEATPIGDYYNLDTLYNHLNKAYFNDTIKYIKIIWGKASTSRRRVRRHIQFGTFDEKNSLIRINPLLDSEKVPKYFIEYIVFHEMLHSKIPPIISPSGRRLFHPPQFKLRERQFKHYKNAVDFENEIFFVLNKEKNK